MNNNNNKNNSKSINNNIDTNNKNNTSSKNHLNNSDINNNLANNSTMIEIIDPIIQQQQNELDSRDISTPTTNTTSTTTTTTFTTAAITTTGDDIEIITNGSHSSIQSLHLNRSCKEGNADDSSSLSSSSSSVTTAASAGSIVQQQNTSQSMSSSSLPNDCDDSSNGNDDGDISSSSITTTTTNIQITSTTTTTTTSLTGTFSITDLQSSSSSSTNSDTVNTNNNSCTQAIFGTGETIILTNAQRFQRSPIFKALKPPPMRENINGFPKLPNITHKEFMWLEQVMKWSKHDGDIVYKLVRMGIPPRIRGFIWRLASGSIELEKKNIGVYHFFLTKSAEEYEYKISKDISRTFPKIELFTQEQGQVTLFNILKAYCILDPVIGYTQGMTFIAAILMHEMDEIESFWTFVCLMKNYKLSTIFSNDLSLLRQNLYVIDRCIEIIMPKLFSHLKEVGVTPVLFASEWISTLFTYNFDIESIKRIWDVFFFEGRYYLIRVVLAVLRIYEKHLMTLQFEECVEFLKKVGFSINIENLLQVTDSIILSKDLLHKFEEEFNNPDAPPSDYF